MARRLNLLVVHNNNDLYGAEVILLELLKRLDKERFYPIVVLPKDTAHIGRFSAELERNGIEFIFLPLGVMRRKYLKPLKIARFACELLIGVLLLVRLMISRRIDVVHSNTLAVTAGAIAAKITRRRHVWHIHEILVDPKPFRVAMHYLIPRLSDVVVVVSNAVRQHMLGDQPKFQDKIRVIHNGIDLERIGSANGGPRVRREWGMAPDAFVIGMVGKVSRWKGQLVFAEAARQLLQQCPEVRFAAVGGVFDDEHHYMERFRETVAELGIDDRFVINDFRSDVGDVLGAYDVFVLPSTLPDPFPTVVLEAMAAGKPVVASAHGGPCEMVVDGETGVLVPPGDSAALSKALLQLFKDRQLTHRMGDAGRCRAWEHYHFPRFIAEFEDLYQTLAGIHSPQGTTSQEILRAQ